MSAFLVLHSVAEWAAKFPASRGAATRAVISVGNFDGLHLGHQQILRRVVERAREMENLPAVVTFDPHPLKVLRPEEAPALVQTLEQRLAGFRSMGLRAALVMHFDRALADLPAQSFAREILAEGLRAEAVLVGQNFRFGCRQAGDVKLLQDMSGELGFVVEIVPAMRVAGEIVSSTAVRRAVAEGQVADAARLLGRPFSLTGAIERGSGRGSTLVVPTLNLAPEQELLPGTGVYATETLVGGRIYRSATNVGFRPTFDGAHLSIESHLFDYAERLTEGRLELHFWERLREERKFSGSEALRQQIAEDLRQARDFFSRRDALAASG